MPVLVGSLVEHQCPRSEIGSLLQHLRSADLAMGLRKFIRKTVLQGRAGHLVGKRCSGQSLTQALPPCTRSC
eukprot:3677278-Amphidinium_carterae.1